MNDNLDDWLNSLGFDEADTHTEAAIPLETTPQEEETPQPQSLSDQDFDDVLSDYGFNQTQEADAEELSDEEDSEIDAEELADWDERRRGIMAQTEEVAESGTGTSATTLSLSDIENALIHGEMERTAIQQEASHTLEETAAMAESSEANVARRRARQHHITAESVENELSQDNPTQDLIQPNSPTLLLDESTSRFSGAEWYNEIQKQHIILAGLGGIGSYCAYQLARMNPASLYLYDDDTVEVVNMAGQMYARDDIGKSKASAVLDMITSYTNTQNVYAINQRFTEDTEAGDVMICGFDSMQARKTFFQSWAAHIEGKTNEEKAKCLFLDGRLSIDTLQVFCMTGNDYANQCRYVHEYLFSDEEAEHTVCSMKQTTYMACMIGSVMVNLFTNWAANQLDPVIPYDLPFFTEYDAQNMIFKTVN